MTTLHYWTSLLFPWLLLTGLLLAAQRRAPRAAGLYALMICGFVALLLMLIPVGGLPVFRWFTIINFQASVPLIGLLAGVIGRKATGRDLFRPHEIRAACLAGALGGIILYPSALGLGKFDLYELGWSFGALPVVIVLAGVALALAGNRACWLMILSVLAWDAQCFDSANCWDYFVDPLFAILGLGALAWFALKRTRLPHPVWGAHAPSRVVSGASPETFRPEPPQPLASACYSLSAPKS